MKTKAKKKLRRMTPYTKRWEAIAGDVARAYAPRIEPCKTCGYPVINGHMCDRCNPRKP